MRHDGKQGERGRKVGGESTALVSNGHLHQSHQRAPLKHISYAGLDELLWFMRQAHTHKHKHTHLPTINISLCFAVVCDMFTLLFSPLLLLLLLLCRLLFEYSIIRLFDYLPFLLSAVRGSRKTWVHSWYHSESPTERRCGYFMFGVGIVSVWLIWIECSHYGEHTLCTHSICLCQLSP